MNRMMVIISREDAGYLETQTLLATYEAKLGEISICQQEEELSQQAYESAQEMIANLPQFKLRREHKLNSRLAIAYITERKFIN
jgi:hypothetical protein